MLLAFVAVDAKEPKGYTDQWKHRKSLKIFRIVAVSNLLWRSRGHQGLRRLRLSDFRGYSLGYRALCEGRGITVKPFGYIQKLHPCSRSQLLALITTCPVKSVTQTAGLRSTHVVAARQGCMACREKTSQNSQDDNSLGAKRRQQVIWELQNIGNPTDQQPNLHPKP